MNAKDSHSLDQAAAGGDRNRLSFKSLTRSSSIKYFSELSNKTMNNNFMFAL